MRPLRNGCQVAVIGGGLAGLAASCHAARLGCLVTVFEGSGLFGGLVATVGSVDGIPVPGRHSGQDIAIHLLEAAREFSASCVEARIIAMDLGARLSLTDQEQRVYHPEAIIIASGATPRRLGVPGEEEFLGRGVSRCATCDGGFFRGQDVIVVGGGDAAVQEALVLARASRRVTMICRSTLRARRDSIEALAARENVSFIWDHEVSEILGENAVTGVRLRHVSSGAALDVPCAGLFPFIGAVPNTAFVPAPMLAPTGHVVTGADLATADARVFAAGAARAEYGGNVVQAMAEGVSAAKIAACLVMQERFERGA